MRLFGFTPLWYILAMLLALISQKGEACYEPEPETITITVSEAL